MKAWYKIISICAFLVFSTQLNAVRINGSEINLEGGNSISYVPDEPGAIGLKIHGDDIGMGSTDVTFNQAAMNEIVPQIVANTRVDVGTTFTVEGPYSRNYGVRLKAGESIDLQLSGENYCELTILEGTRKIRLTAQKNNFKTCFVKTGGRLHLIAPKNSEKCLREIEVEFAAGENEFFDGIVNGEIDFQEMKTEYLFFTNAKLLTLHFRDPDAEEEEEEEVEKPVSDVCDNNNGAATTTAEAEQQDAAAPAPASAVAAVTVDPGLAAAAQL